MHPLIQEVSGACSPEALIQELGRAPGVMLLRSALFDSHEARYSYVTARPFLTFRSFGARCELFFATEAARAQFGNPWHLLDSLMARYELLDELDLPFPLGGCFGYWGYDLKNFVEPKLERNAIDDLELPDCQVGFYDSVVAFDHLLQKNWIISTGLGMDGSRTEGQARHQLEFWRSRMQPEEERKSRSELPSRSVSVSTPSPLSPEQGFSNFQPHSNFSQAGFLNAIRRAQRYIQAGDVYQVNLAQRLSVQCDWSGWDAFQGLAAVSPAPFSAYFDPGEFQIASSSPELFLRLSGSHILTRPIKGTRPRSPDPTRDAQLTYELQTSPKEMAELVMITDLLRNDLGRVCEYGSVQVPELARLERFSQVQHLVSTIEGRLRPDSTHFKALAQCFPGGSVTGAPKIRAMEIIDELEPVARGPYTGCLGYLGFNRESQLSILIRTVICKAGWSYFHAGAGIVADSQPEAEYEETLAKAAGFLAALRGYGQGEIDGNRVHVISPDWNRRGT